VTYNSFCAVLQGDPCLNATRLCNVSEAGGETVEWAFNVTLCSEAPPRKASALATFLTARKEFGATSLSSQVVDFSGRVVQPRKKPLSKRKVGREC